MNRIAPHFYSGSNLTGKLLVAAPHLAGSPFDRSVILVLQEEAKAVFGVVLTNPASNEQAASWEEKWSEISNSDVARNSMISGPMPGPVFALHQNQEIAELEVGRGIFVSRTEEALQALAESAPYSDQPLPYRIVFGIVGFQTGQIKNHIADGHWLVLDGDADLVFDDTDYIWDESLRTYGNKIAHFVTGHDPNRGDCYLN